MNKFVHKKEKNKKKQKKKEPKPCKLQKAQWQLTTRQTFFFS